ncbi:MAG: hypothetical protein F4X20_07360 [Dehalococcoidia bacterium]|nr:hypothetical protein [Dehalococcoidia bacterium]
MPSLPLRESAYIISRCGEALHSMRRWLAIFAVFIVGSIAVSGCDGDPSYTVYFQSDRNGNWDIYSIQHDGTMEAQVTDHPADDLYPVVNSDGTKVAFIRRSGNATDVILVDTEEGNEINLTNGRAGGTIESITWYPEGDRLLVTLWTMGLASGRPQLYWMGEEGMADDDTGMHLLGQDTAYSYWNPRMNAAGEEIAVSASLSLESVDVHILDSAGQFIRVVPHETFLRPTGEFRAPTATEDYADYAPNGRDVIMQSNAPALTNPSNAIHLWYVSSQGRRSADLTPDAPYNSMQPAWSTVLDGQTIVFASDRDGNNEIYLWSQTEGAEPVRLTDNPANDSNPSWLRNDPNAD